ncbi:type II toxin-antitoxin system VapC family toxin [Xanthobacteraceae bacterium Astr-EGSB]|uniref:type II toxin-antitoxin system VapC family toxin n=1 Tax=Astrobacterium formosum TaxID=3069710 RepID=UPI0027AF2052|nr:type II toxin-antitoxin system VapC family toxin [Xanthobacteraceae bacterium Astr-EGSB]
MVLDTSAIIAVIFGEPERPALMDVMAEETRLVVSALTLYETSVVAVGKKRDRTAIDLVDDMIRRMSIEVAAVTTDDAIAARAAYLRFGRGWHPANLNLADCFPYALAKARDEPLLYKGNDFSKTDIVPAWRP